MLDVYILIITKKMLLAKNMKLKYQKLMGIKKEFLILNPLIVKIKKIIIYQEQKKII